MTAVAVAYAPPIPGTTTWTDAEDAVLRERYIRDGGTVCAAVLGRTWTSVCHRAERLGLIRKRRWTTADDRRLRMLWGQVTLEQAAAQLGRTPITVAWRSKKLGLPAGCPQGFEYVRAAAERTGYASETLRRILTWWRVRLHPTMALARGPRRFTCQVVDTYEVDEAVTEWLKREPVNAAAERHGIDHGTLVRWLEASGRPLPKRPGGKRRWYVPSETIEAVIAEHRARESVTQAAKRLGIHRCALGRWLSKAGVARTGNHTWWLEPGQAERAIEERNRACRAS